MSDIRLRKGIYQAFSTNGDVTADERWRLISTLDKGVRIDTDAVRISPFAEPRDESFNLELNPHFEHRRSMVLALNRSREVRMDFHPGSAAICWRIGETSRTLNYAWTSDCEIGYNSPLFITVVLWRHPLKTGQSALLRVAQLDAISLEPTWVKLVITNVAIEQHKTRFGLMELTRYKLETEDRCIDHCWCDQDGIVFDYWSSDPTDNASCLHGGFTLVAVNFPN